MGRRHSANALAQETAQSLIPVKPYSSTFIQISLLMGANMEWVPGEVGRPSSVL